MLARKPARHVIDEIQQDVPADVVVCYAVHIDENAHTRKSICGEYGATFMVVGYVLPN
jgi:hypothetical protein